MICVKRNEKEYIAAYLNVLLYESAGRTKKIDEKPESNQ
jgi:hypothetical protein